MSRDILSMTFSELSDAFSDLGIQKFRAKQVYEWLHKHLASDYDEMLKFPKRFVRSFQKSYLFTPVKSQESRFQSLTAP